MGEVKLEDILEILNNYDKDNITIATLGSHTSLHILQGAKEEGFRTAIVCEKGREVPYQRFDVADEYIIVDSKGYIELTEKGTKVATTIYDRHDTLSSFFESIGVSHDTAVNDACRIEHVISDETMNKIKEHMKQK